MFKHFACRLKFKNLIGRAGVESWSLLSVFSITLLRRTRESPAQPAGPVFPVQWDPGASATVGQPDMKRAS